MKSVPGEVKRVCPAPVQEKDEDKPIVSKGKVLLMDDEYVIRTILSKQLRHSKYEVELITPSRRNLIDANYYICINLIKRLY